MASVNMAVVRGHRTQLSMFRSGPAFPVPVRTRSRGMVEVEVRSRQCKSSLLQGPMSDGRAMSSLGQATKPWTDVEGFAQRLIHTLDSIEHISRVGVRQSVKCWFAF